MAFQRPSSTSTISADRSNPVLIKDVRIDGAYFDARLIDEYVYVVATEYTYDIYRALDDKNYTLTVPEISIDEDEHHYSPNRYLLCGCPGALRHHDPCDLHQP